MSDLYPIIYPNFENQFPLWDGSLGNPGCDNCGMMDADVKVGGTYYCETCYEDAKQYSKMFIDASFSTIKETDFIL